MRGADVSESTCPVCGGEVPAKSATGPRKTYCSDGCKRRAAQEAPATTDRARRRSQQKLSTQPWHTCPCGARFQGVSRRRYCSEECAREADKARAKDSRVSICSRTGCGRPTRARDLCAPHYERQRYPTLPKKPFVWTESKKAAWRKRQALIRGASEGQPFRYRDVFDRDGWICGICTAAVDPGLSWPHPMSASLDHKIPVSLGGVHSPENAQCSHLSCNSRKGARTA